MSAQNQELKMQVLNYAISLYPHIRDAILLSMVNSNEMQPEGMVNDIIKQAINSVVPMLMAHGINEYSLNQALMLSQENSSMFILGDKSYKTTVNLSLNIEELVGN